MLAHIQSELNRHRVLLSVVGHQVTYGAYRVGEGMHCHVDGALQGGEVSLVVGEIVFWQEGADKDSR